MQGRSNVNERWMESGVLFGLDEIRRYAGSWDGWEAYATFYLWRGLEGHAEISTDELA
ncbi:hypothetical protein ACE3MS_19015 [Paenibacillus dendritiformis]|uniref:hypothetical protein n=1 Tax=Paenibacillus dendritiformis TaxID=130049 RepID=UPI001408C16E|nr:hypothetical protein [Paenibacillus dendritiformis]